MNIFTRHASDPKGGVSQRWHLSPQGATLAARDPSLRWGDGLREPS